MTDKKPDELILMRRAAKLLPDLSPAGLLWLQQKIAEEMERRDPQPELPGVNGK